MMRRTILLTAAFALVVGGAVSAIAANGDGGNTYTACLSRGGALNKVAIGEEPVSPCRDDQTQVSWSEGVSPTEFADLTQRVADLELTSYGPMDLFVDCDAGDTVGAALADAQDHPGPVNITISGVCEENIVINRDDVHLSGMERSDGIRAADDEASTVTIDDARRVGFSSMTISAGTSGIEAWAGSVFAAEAVTVRDATWGAVNVGPGSSASLSDCSILDNPAFGVAAGSGGAVQLASCEVSGNGQGLFAGGGHIFGWDLHVIRNDNGVGAHLHGEVSIYGSIVEENGTGMSGQLNSSIKAGEGTRIANNDTGVWLADGSVFVMSGSILEDNGAGIQADGASTVAVGWPTAAIVRNNAGDGIFLGDLSNGDVGDDSQIVDNGGWGVNCAGPSAITWAQLPGGTAADLSGNTLGGTNCPTS